MSDYICSIDTGTKGALVLSECYKGIITVKEIFELQYYYDPDVSLNVLSISEFTEIVEHIERQLWLRPYWVVENIFYKENLGYKQIGSMLATHFVIKSILTGRNAFYIGAKEWKKALVLTSDKKESKALTAELALFGLLQFEDDKVKKKILKGRADYSEAALLGKYFYDFCLRKDTTGG